MAIYPIPIMPVKNSPDQFSRGGKFYLGYFFQGGNFSCYTGVEFGPADSYSDMLTTASLRTRGLPQSLWLGQVNASTWEV